MLSASKSKFKLEQKCCRPFQDSISVAVFPCMFLLILMICCFVMSFYLSQTLSSVLKGQCSVIVAFPWYLNIY